MDIERWEFALLANGDRLEPLTNPPPFEAIVERIRNGMQILCCHRSPCRDNSRFSRAAYCIRVERDLFDLFFNSRNGYRSCYYRCPYDGLRANGVFMRSLSHALLTSEQTESSGMGIKFIEESLYSLSSKVWLAEVEKEVSRGCPGCAGEWNSPQSYVPEIINDRWERSAEPNARLYGNKAPYLTKLRILGAFLDDQHNEFIPENKRHRARHIHEWGWS